VSALINLANDAKKQVFTNEKFLLNLNEQGYKMLCLLIEKFVYIDSSKEVFALKYAPILSIFFSIFIP
jgi:hypothetical protein